MEQEQYLIFNGVLHLPGEAIVLDLGIGHVVDYLGIYEAIVFET